MQDTSADFDCQMVSFHRADVKATLTADTICILPPPGYYELCIVYYHNHMVT